METKVRDLQYAAFLKARGCPLVRMERDDNRKVFIFTRVPEGAELAFCQDTHNVSAHQLFDAYFSLKGLIYGR
jgi:hypothetical protein